jgi:geranylgeranyl pyrophosphate synthase
VTSAAATLERIAAKATTAEETLATRLLDAAAELGDRRDAAAVERASTAVALLEAGAGLHAELLDPGVAHGAGPPESDPPTSALAGAWLVGRGAEEIAACGDEAAAQWAAAAREMVGARMNEFEDLYDAGRSPARRLAIAESRTGALLALAASLGATLGAAGRSSIEAAREFGRQLGVAVEIGDEVASPAIASGRYPVALLYALEAEPDLATRLGRPLTGDEATGVLDAVEAAGGVESAERERGERIEAARRAIDRLSAESLTALADEVAERR